MNSEAESFVRLEGAAATHVGRRKHNEDVYLTTARLFAVADGMGGHEAGEVAAAMAVSAIAALAELPIVETEDLAAAIHRANDEIFVRGKDRPASKRMGTTITGIALSRPELGAARVLVFNVGDSRTYVFRQNVLTQVTRDHSLVQELVDAGELTAERARGHRQRNVVTRALGVDADVAIDFFDFPAGPGDRFLLCSDGLEVLPEDRIRTLLRTASASDCAATLVDAAVKSGARDNVTAVVADVRLEHRDDEPIDDTLDGPIGSTRPLAPPPADATIEIPTALVVNGPPIGAAGAPVARTRRSTRKSAP